MPHPPSILASVMSVTFVGQGPLPKSRLNTTFRVRRAAIEATIRWLIANNPKYYGDIQLDDEVLQSLPRDDVTDDILANIHQVTDTGVLDEDNGGYVPREDAEPDYGKMLDPSYYSAY